MRNRPLFLQPWPFPLGFGDEPTASPWEELLRTSYPCGVSLRQVAGGYTLVDCTHWADGGYVEFNQGDRAGDERAQQSAMARLRLRRIISFCLASAMNHGGHHLGAPDVGTARSEISLPSFEFAGPLSSLELTGQTGRIMQMIENPGPRPRMRREGIEYAAELLGQILSLNAADQELVAATYKAASDYQDSQFEIAFGSAWRVIEQCLRRLNSVSPTARPTACMLIRDLCAKKLISQELADAMNRAREVRNQLLHEHATPDGRATSDLVLLAVTTLNLTFALTLRLSLSRTHPA